MNNSGNPSVSEDVLPSPEASSNPALKLFIPLMLVTLIPLLGMPVLYNLDVHFDHIPLIGWALFFGGVGHVAGTAFFYGDRDVLPIMNGMKARFYALPMLVVAITLVTVLLRDTILLSKTFVAGMFFIHLCWLHYHYQKQNYGLVALTAANHKQRLPKPFLTLVMLPALAGGLAVIPPLLSDVIQVDTPLSPYYAQLKLAGQILYGAAVLLVAGYLLQHRLLFKTPLIALFATATFCFYLPAILVENIYYAFWSYALAHGFQYLLMLGFVAGGSKRRWQLGGLFFLAALGGGSLLKRLHGTDALLLCGVALNWVHFILDARLWKMSDDKPRQYLKQRLALIFK